MTPYRGISMLVVIMLVICTLALANCYVVKALSVETPLCYFVEKTVTKGVVPVIVMTINSPFNGMARMTNKWTFYWQFGSLVSQSMKYSVSYTVETFNGEAVALIRPAIVAIKDVYFKCIGWYHEYVGRVAEIEKFLRETYLVTYEKSGSRIDNTIVCAYTKGTSNGMCVAPIYEENDYTYFLFPGHSSIDVEITASNSLSTDVQIGISVGGITLPGIFRATVSTTATKSVEYLMKANPHCFIIHNVDYRGSYDLSRNEYPMIWAFNTEVYCTSQKGNVKFTKLLIPHASSSEAFHNVNVIVLWWPSGQTEYVRCSNIRSPICSLVTRMFEKAQVYTQSNINPAYIVFKPISKKKVILMPVEYLRNSSNVLKVEWIINNTKRIDKPYITLTKSNKKTILHIEVRVVTIDKRVHTYDLTVLGAIIK